MFYVYIIQSISDSSRIYKGFTKNLSERLVKHNKGDGNYTAKFRPWKLIFYCAFKNKIQALKFEEYLKSGSGSAFLRKHFL